MNNIKDVSSANIFITLILLIVTIVAYMLVNKYIIKGPNDTEEKIVEKETNEITENEILKLASEKYYAGITILTKTKDDIDKLYNPIETKDIILTDENLINELNKYNQKTYDLNSTVTVVSNFDEAIKGNFTDDFINNNILMDNGYIAQINKEYYIIKEKTDNYFFKEADISLVSKNENEMHFKVKNTNYSNKCLSAGATIPSITCTDTTTGDENDFVLVKQDNKWKIKEIKIS